MTSTRLWFGLLALICSGLVIPATALAAVTYTTFPAPGSSGGACLGQGDPTAVGVKVPAGDDYILNSANVSFYGSVPGSLPFSLEVYDDNAGVPGSSVAPIASISTTAGTRLYALTAATPITLNAGETYWIVGNSSNPDYCEFSWARTTTDPTGGVFSLVGEQSIAFNSTSWGDVTGPPYLALEIDADPLSQATAPVAVPTMSQWGLLLLAFCMVMIAGLHLRRR